MKSILYILSLVCLSLLVACTQPSEPEKPKGIVRINTTPTDLPIIVNGQPKGNSSSQGGQLFSITLEEGEYTIEVLKSIDEEKDLYGTKSILVAGDTLQTIYIDAQERLTDFGVEQKARRDTEAEAAAIEKERIAQQKKLKAAEIKASKIKKEKEFQQKMAEVNRADINFLNSTVVTPNISNRYQKVKHRYKVVGCNITVNEDDLGKSFRDSDNSFQFNVDARKLDIKKSTKIGKAFFALDTRSGVHWQKNSSSYTFHCKNEVNCIQRILFDNNFRSNVDYETYVSTTNGETNISEPIMKAFERILTNCQT